MFITRSDSLTFNKIHQKMVTPQAVLSETGYGRSVNKALETAA